MKINYMNIIMFEEMGYSFIVVELFDVDKIVIILYVFRVLL